MNDIFLLQQIALGFYYPSAEQMRDIAQELLNFKAGELYRVRPSEGNTTFVFGKQS